MIEARRGRCVVKSGLVMEFARSYLRVVGYCAVVCAAQIFLSACAVAPSGGGTGAEGADPPNPSDHELTEEEYDRALEDIIAF